MKIKQTNQSSDYQSDIYEARVKIAEARWESGHVSRGHETKKDHIEKH